MSTTAKVELVRSVQDEFGLTSTLTAIGLPRATWYYRLGHPNPYEERHARLRAPLERIACEHPEYGHRRTTAELRERLGVSINPKVVRRLHQCWGLPLVRRTQPPRPSGLRQVIVAAGGRVNLLAELEEVAPLAVLHTDFTELVYAAGKAQLMALVDHTSKVVPGWAVGAHADTALALRAWTAAKRWLRRHDWPVTGIIVHHDQGSVYTGYDWTGRLVLRDRVRLSYALEVPRQHRDGIVPQPVQRPRTGRCSSMRQVSPSSSASSDSGSTTTTVGDVTQRWATRLRWSIWQA